MAKTRSKVIRPVTGNRFTRSRRVRHTARWVLVVLTACLVTSCSNAPPPPIVTTSAEPTTTSPNSPAQLVVGLDEVVGGYNPHNLADLSTVTTALSQLLLPSVFRPSGPHEYELDKSLMRSAEVISEEPFKVAYEIQQDASWSDGAPIAVEDFVYLADAMRSEPGTVQPAGYRLISSIQPGEGGKRVEVTFSKPYPGWRSLFANLLPAHLLKDAPGGWQGALATSFPAYGGPFSIKKLDIGRGEIILERNERYWEKPAVLDQLILRRADPSGIVTGLRSGTNQLALTRPDAAGLKQLGELGSSVQLHTLPNPQVVEVVLRPGGVLAVDQVRAGLSALIDRGRLIEKGALGGPSAGLRADAQVLPPTDANYRATMPNGVPPATADPEKAQQLLRAAGYAKEAGTWRKDGKPLSVVLAAPGKQEPYATIANELVAQLTAAGVEVRLINPPARELFSDLLAMPIPVDGKSTQQPESGSGVGVDIAVIPQVLGGDPASVLASNFGCRTDQQTESPTAPKVPENSAAFCDKNLQPTIEAALTGGTSLAQTLADLEPELWGRNTTIPLFQLADTLVMGAGTTGVTPGPPLAGPFGSAVNWARVPK